MKRKTTALIPTIIILLSFSCVKTSAIAAYKDDIGYITLQSELGINIPTGAGVKVTQVEAEGKPDPNNAQFIGKIFTDNYLGVSGHATTVGQYFYGNSSSISPGVNNIECWAGATAWLNNYSYGDPLVSSSRVANHSWVGGIDSISFIRSMSRLDWVVHRDEFTHAVAMNNGSRRPQRWWQCPWFLCDDHYSFHPLRFS
jgi:hypothetical protein